jgi:predicted phage baseplate assembly protein
VTLPAPRLDDRSFQDIVDEAKRRIHRLAPDWTDHNVSDPGVALIELFAWMTEMILYRLNQVPDRLYLKFLELLGIERHGAVAATTDLLFRLTAPQPAAVRIPSGTQVASDRREDAEPVVFQTTAELQITPPTLVHCLTGSKEKVVDQSERLLLTGGAVTCFTSLTPGDAFYLGFEQSLAANLLRISLLTGTEGAGVDPNRPPLRWESWDGDEWAPAQVLEDTTLGLNVDDGGEVLLLLAAAQAPLALGQTRAHWLRCRLVEPSDGAPGYAKSPVIHKLEVVSVGGAAPAIHADTAPAEFLGISSGEPSQTFRVSRYPVLKREVTETVYLQLAGSETGGGSEQTWREVRHFGGAGAADPVFTWDSASGEVRFGPQVRLSNGLMRQYGAIPPADARVMVTGYRHGGGRRGNVSAGRLTVLRTSIPFVSGVTNLAHARNGVDAETVEDVKVRGPLSLRTSDRAVTAEDFERLAHEATEAVGRARCLPGDDGSVRVLIVPRTDRPAREVELDHLVLDQGLVGEVAGYLDQRRLVTTRVQLGEPRYLGVMVVAQVTPLLGLRPETVREAATEAVYQFLHPLHGGADGRGWPFGQALGDGDMHAVLRGVPGVGGVTRVLFFMVNLRSGEVDQKELQRITLPPDALVLSHKHQIVVSEGPGKP